jgi:hypothetical protein
MHLLGFAVTEAAVRSADPSPGPSLEADERPPAPLLANSSWSNAAGWAFAPPVSFVLGGFPKVRQGCARPLSNHAD